MNWPCANRIYCPILLSGVFHSTFKGKYVGFIDADFSGHITGNFQGHISGTFTGSILGDFCGHLTGTFHGLIGGVQFDGHIDQNICTSINGTFTGDIDGDFGGRLDGTFTGHLTGNLDAVIDALIDGTLRGRFGGLIDGVPTDSDYPFPNLTNEPPDVPGGFPPDISDPFNNWPPNTGGPGLNPGPYDPGDVPPGGGLVYYFNSEQSYEITCPDTFVYNSIVPANLYRALTQAVADQQALDAAVENANTFCTIGTVPALVQSDVQTCNVTCSGGTVQSVSSQAFAYTLAAANANALAFACQLAALTCSPLSPELPVPPGGTPPGGGGGLPPIPPPNPPGGPAPSVLFTNSDQTATVACPTGGTFSYTCKAGRFFSSATNTDQNATANAMALSFALDQAMTLRFCVVALENRNNQGFLPVNDFRVALNGQFPGALITLARTGPNTLYANPYTFVLTGGPPALIPPPVVVLLGAAPEWTLQFGTESARTDATTAGQFATLFTVTQDRPGYRIVASRSIPWFVGDISTPSPLPDASVGGSYFVQLETEFMLAPFTWTLTELSDPLPDGLTLNANGTITGEAENVDTETIEVQVVDAAGVIFTKQFDISSVASCISNSSPLAAGTVGTPYSVQLLAPGLTAPLNWTNTGALPGGLSLDPDTGFITGTPTAAATFNFQANVIDDNNVGCNKMFQIVVTDSTPSTCGWWDDFPLANQNDPVDPGVTATTTPADLDGVSEFDMSLQVPGDAPNINTLTVFGTKNYTGSSVIIKVVLDVTTFETGFGEPADISVYFNSVLLLQVSAVGTYEATAQITDSVAQDIPFYVTISRNPQVDPGTINCSLSLGAGQNDFVSQTNMWRHDLWHVFPGLADIVYQITDETTAPSCVISLLSSIAKSWQMEPKYEIVLFPVAPTLSVDGVNIPLIDGGGGYWVSAPAKTTIALDNCVQKLVVFDGPSMITNVSQGLNVLRFFDI